MASNRKFFFLLGFSFGAMIAMLGVGGPIADERSVGWNRQLPFAGLAVFVGHLLTADTIGPVIGGTTAILAFLGGAWYPLGDGVLHDVGQVLPSYWLVQASQVPLGGNGWGALGWVVVSVWTVALALLAARAYRRDTSRA